MSEFPALPFTEYATKAKCMYLLIRFLSRDNKKLLRESCRSGEQESCQSGEPKTSEGKLSVR